MTFVPSWLIFARSFNKPLQHHRFVGVQIRAALEADGNGAIDDVKPAMALDVAGIGAHFLAELIAIGMRRIDRHRAAGIGSKGRRRSATVPRRHFEVAHRNPHGIHVAARGELVDQLSVGLISEIGVCSRQSFQSFWLEADSRFSNSGMFAESIFGCSSFGALAAPQRALTGFCVRFGVAGAGSGTMSEPAAERNGLEKIDGRGSVGDVPFWSNEWLSTAIGYPRRLLAKSANRGPSTQLEVLGSPPRMLFQILSLAIVLMFTRPGSR